MPPNAPAAQSRGTLAPESSQNPFQTLFDDQADEESDDAWWDDEGDTKATSESANIHVSQWPKPPDGNNARGEPKVTTRSTHKVEKKYSVYKPIREKSKGRQRKQNAKIGIKVVTTFTRHEGPAPKIEPQTTIPQPGQTAPNAGRFVDLATLQALGADGADIPVSFWKSKQEKAAVETESSGNIGASNGGMVEAQNAAGKSVTKDNQALHRHSDLSPDDRPIFIGISVPSDEAAERIISAQTPSDEVPRMLENIHHGGSTNHLPETPAIIITPAQEKSYWSPSTAATDSAVRSRVSSSIYSRPPFDAFGLYNDKDAPPLPVMPSSVLDNERQRIEVQKSFFSPDSDDGTFFGKTPIEPHINARSRSDTAGSNETVFEEDVSPIISRKPRAVSYTEASKAARRASVSTVATRRWSKGWWNYITTPFLSRSSTFADRSPQKQQTPAVPDLALAVAKARDAQRADKGWEKQSSPMTPATATTTSSESWWTPGPRLQHEKQPNAAGQSPVLLDTRHKVQESSGSLPLVATIHDIGSASASVHSGSTCESPVTDHLARLPGDQPIERGVPGLSSPPSTRELRSNNPFVQPSLTNINGSPLPAAMVNAGPQLSSIRTSPQPPPYSPPHAHIPKYRAVFPPGHPRSDQEPLSPGPLSPGLQRAMAASGGIPLAEVPLAPTARRPMNLNSSYPEASRNAPVWVTVNTEFLPPPKAARKAEARRQRYEKEDAVAYRAGGWWRGRGCISNRGCYGRTGAEGRKRRRCYFCLIAWFIIMIILIVTLATTLHHKSRAITSESQWLNLTGFPPIPTGFATVAAPVNTIANTGCTFPATVWSCALPKEEQASVSPYNPNQPNFLLQIQWDNSSATNATFANVTGNHDLVTRSGNAVSASKFIKRLLQGARDIVTWSPSPSAPNYAEEFFLGNSTDGVVSSNKAGESTPFYISFFSTANVSAVTDQLSRRAVANETDPFPNVTSFIPDPSINSDGTAAAANLYPFPVQQPIRLYDRGLITERYSFYNYYNRSIFLKSLTPLNESNLENGEVPDDENGGCTEAEANFRCTWAETRFLVEMWTRMNGTARLNNSTSSSTTRESSKNATIDFTQPGTFPYPITITIDRHGGDPSSKLLYCYAVNDREQIDSSSGTVRAENRGFGGTLINQAPSTFVNNSDPSLGGFDGGTGGCSCQWTNFQHVLQG
ncbi:hypothetical protein BP5796_11728 [Coleophoma crateriformis]|uniref:Glycoprotease family protein n=1 Tax=Coleophoma crateriformis TaxID=565419 RepID=A0A3D8QE46_9HELO|nr:hypothetical protein BP5796_11728 [Coleophoma crateriformis]